MNPASKKSLAAQATSGYDQIAWPCKMQQPRWPCCSSSALVRYSPSIIHPTVLPPSLNHLPNLPHRTAKSRRPVHHPLRPLDPGADWRCPGLAAGQGHQQGSVQLPEDSWCQVRRGFLEPWLGHYSPDHPWELRLSRLADGRHGLAHAQWRWPVLPLHRCWWCRCRRRDGEYPLGAQVPQSYRCEADRRAERMDEPQGHHPEGGWHPHREGRNRGHRRVLRPRCRQH